MRKSFKGFCLPSEDQSKSRLLKVSPPLMKEISYTVTLFYPGALAKRKDQWQDRWHTGLCERDFCMGTKGQQKNHCAQTCPHYQACSPISVKCWGSNWLLCAGEQHSYGHFTVAVVDFTGSYQGLMGDWWMLSNFKQRWPIQNIESALNTLGPSQGDVLYT